MKVKCVVCGKDFEAIKSTKKYCSKECMNIARRKRKMENKGNNGIQERSCAICGKVFIPKTSLASMRLCCYDCIPDGIQLTRSTFLHKIKQYLGGKCIRCGYDKCIKALEFHHIDPSKKDFTISNDQFRLLDAVEEIKKCILVCSNCHKEFHAGLWSLKDLNLEKEEVDLDTY